jgi:hypothetical protein
VDKDELLLAKGSGTPVVQSAPDADFQVQSSGKSVYDPGESIVKKMNTQHAAFDKDEFFEALFENYLVAVERHEPRQHPDSRIITEWNMHTTFEDFLDDAVKILDKKMEAAKLAKMVGTSRLAAIDDSILNETTFKLDSGSSTVGKKFDGEDYEATYELMSRSKEAIMDYKAGRTTLIINEKTGRIRMGGSTL